MDPTSEVPPVEKKAEETTAAPHLNPGEKVLLEAEKGLNDSAPTISSSHSVIDEKNGEKKKAAPASGAASDAAESSELEAILKELPEDERRILKDQLDAPTVQVSFLTLYRYASAWDYAIIFVSSICAIAGGAALPLFTVSEVLDSVCEAC